MLEDEKVLGFDVREIWLDPADLWNAQRKSDLLFRLDVVKPLSTDSMVWPSAFDVDADLCRPSWTGYVQDLWEDLEGLQECLRLQWGSKSKPCRTIAVTLLRRSCREDQHTEWDERVVSTNPFTLGKEWSLLGYDVSDNWLLSGLSNIGFSPGIEDVSSMRARWTQSLNEFHLFDSPVQAMEFKLFSDQRVINHAPFFVYGLWQILERVAGVTH